MMISHVILAFTVTTFGATWRSTVYLVYKPGPEISENHMKTKWNWKLTFNSNLKASLIIHHGPKSIYGIALDVPFWTCMRTILPVSPIFCIAECFLNAILSSAWWCCSLSQACKHTPDCWTAKHHLQWHATRMQLLNEELLSVDWSYTCPSSILAVRNSIITTKVCQKLAQNGSKQKALSKSSAETWIECTSVKLYFQQSAKFCPTNHPMCYWPPIYNLLSKICPCFFSSFRLFWGWWWPAGYTLSQNVLRDNISTPMYVQN